MQRRSSGSSGSSTSEDRVDASTTWAVSGPAPADLEGRSGTVGSKETTDVNAQNGRSDLQPSCLLQSGEQVQEHDRQQGAQSKSSATRIRRPSSNLNWKPGHARNGSVSKEATNTRSLLVTIPSDKGMVLHEKLADQKHVDGRSRPRSPWAVALSTLVVSLAGIAVLVAIVSSSLTRQLDPKGCRMSYMSPRYIHLSEFDTEHTRFASKYSLYLYREAGVNDEPVVSGIPVLFIPGNAGSYKQVRPIAAEAARFYHDTLQHDAAAAKAGVSDLDFFTVDFNEDFTAFHGQTMLDQAEYLNEAIRYILSLYLDARSSGRRDPDLPDPTSVIILGHSMGGIVARTMLVMPNYQFNSINTIVTMSAPHARPPVSFDSDIVKIYNDINSHWRQAYSQKWANDNPLWHVTLVSIAGGGLDTVVPSDYASLESIVPDTHGFTVFTSTVPTVWTSMDHAAILWCDQFRKVVARALFDIVDTGRASQTKPRADRMRVFKKWFLTGLEAGAEKSLTQTEAEILLTLDDNSNDVLRLGERLVLRALGQAGKVKVHLLPVPPLDVAEEKRFSLMTDSRIDGSGDGGRFDVLFCGVFPLQPGQSGTLLAMNMDLSGDSTGSTRLACKNAAADVIQVPASGRDTALPFYRDNERPIAPFSYLQYSLEDMADHQFVAVVEKATSERAGWAVAEFSAAKDYRLTSHSSLGRLLALGLQLDLPADRPMVTELRIPAIQSSLLAYRLETSQQPCGGSGELFAPLVRQFISEPYESKFFVNAREAQVSLHGLAPYLPPPMTARRSGDGLSFQFWTDPTCASFATIRLRVDALGSLGKLYMRYRTVFAAFPLLVVAMVLRKQFRIYDNTGVFIPFLESLDICLRQSLPLLLLSLTLLALSMHQSDDSRPHRLWPRRNTTSAVEFSGTDMLVGITDPFFCFLLPLIGLVCVGVCAVVHYITLIVSTLLALVQAFFSLRRAESRVEEKRRMLSPAFVSSSPRRRLITTGLLLFLVSTFIPYQFAYLVACLVQMGTSIRALGFARDMPSLANSNFYNYIHSILLLMLWVLPINLPTLVVWVRNLAVHWFTPFSSHHNVLSILPFILLVETLTTGRMIPRVTSRFRHLTSILLFCISVYAAMYGVSYAYMLHYLVNLVAAWFVVIHSTAGDSWSLADLRSIFDAAAAGDVKQAKTP